MSRTSPPSPGGLCPLQALRPTIFVRVVELFLEELEDFFVGPGRGVPARRVRLQCGFNLLSRRAGDPAAAYRGHACSCSAAAPCWRFLFSLLRPHGRRETTTPSS